MREEAEMQDMKSVTNYNPFLSNIDPYKIKRKLKLQTSSSLVSKKQNNELFVGGEFIRRLSQADVKKD